MMLQNTLPPDRRLEPPDYTRQCSCGCGQIVDGYPVRLHGFHDEEFATEDCAWAWFQEHGDLVFHTLIRLGRM